MPEMDARRLLIARLQAGSRQHPLAKALVEYGKLLRTLHALRWFTDEVRRGRHMTGPVTYDDLRADTVLQVAKLMAAAAITAPKSAGQLFLAGKHNFIETVIIDDADTRQRLAEWMRARGAERRETIWFRYAEVIEAIDAVLYIGLVDWYPPNYDCGACGYATAPSFSTPPNLSATTPPSSSSPAPPATSVTSTSVLPSAPWPRPPPSTPSTAAARPAPPLPPATSASSGPTSPSPSPCP